VSTTPQAYAGRVCEARCRALIEQACGEHEWTILALAIQPDHLHLFVRT
jgi:REP element-mobilizing transposase RayT